MPKKTISTLAVAAALALGVVACGGGSDNSGSGDKSAKSSGPATGTITIWARDAQKTFMGKLVDAYNSSHKAQAKLSIIPSAHRMGMSDSAMEAKLNVHGGSIAVGHPFGMTGARIATTLLNGLRAKDATIGLETMCVGGGQGMAMVVERLS